MGIIIHTAVTTILTITLTRTITPHIITIPTATITTPLSSIPEFTPGIVVAAEAAVVAAVVVVAGVAAEAAAVVAVVVAAMADIADTKPASRGLSASSRKALKKRAGLA
jgi:hypothetical protein